MTTLSELEKKIVIAGFKSLADYIIKFALPITGTCFLVGIIFMYLFPIIGIVVPITIIMLGLLFAGLYPVIMWERKRKNIQENIHLFITYAGTIATLKISRAVLFKKIAQKKLFAEISEIAEKILYLSKSWNIGFARTCRKISKLVPSKTLGDFLDRFAVMMDFGQDLDTFLIEEQSSVMDDFATEYKKSLENIKMMQESFVSLTIALALLMSVALLMPVIMGSDIRAVLRYSLFGLMMLDGFLLFFVMTFIPLDKLCHNLDDKDLEYLKIRKLFMSIAPLSVGILIFLYIIDKMPFLINVAIASTPLVIVAFYANLYENKIFARDKLFPSYIRTLGATVDIKVGAVTSSLGSLRIHDFGDLNQMSINLYRRLKLGCDKYKAWHLFAVESGSNLISHFSHIFSEAVYLGGNAEKTGLIVSDNFFRILSLRKLRQQIASGVRSALYVSLVGFSAVAYVAAQTSVKLIELFDQTQAGLTFEDALGAKTINSVVSSLLPNIEPVSLSTIGFYLGLMILIHVIVSAFVIKIVDGGNMYAAFFDVAIMIWMGGIISWGAPILTEKVLPTQAFNATAAVTEMILPLLSSII